MRISKNRCSVNSDDHDRAQGPVVGAVEELAVSHRGDGAHRVLKAVVDGWPVVIKVYGLKRSRFDMLLRQFGSLVLVGKSSISAAGRCRTERATLARWRQEGFHVPAEASVAREVLAAAGVSGRNPWLTLEWVDGPALGMIVKREDIALRRKEEIVADFAHAIAERHARALEIDEPRLLCEHPTFEHVIFSDGRFVFFDFEIVFTGRSKVETLIARELAGFVRSLFRMAGKDFAPLLRALVSAYPEKHRLKRVRDDFERFGAVPVFDWLRLVPAGNGLARLPRGAKHTLRQKMVSELDRALKDADPAGSEADR